MELLLLVGLSLTSGGFVLALLSRLNRRLPNRGGAVFLWLFLFAGALSVLPGFALYAVAEWVLPLEAGRWGQVMFTWTVNAPAEELAKYACFAVLAGALGSIKEPQDGSLQGAATGLGFGLVENFLYGLSGGWELLLLRALVSLPGHVIYGAVWGGYHGFEVYQGQGRLARWWIPLLALVPAAFSHAVFNTLTLVGAPLVLAVACDALTLAFGAFLFLRLRQHSPSYLQRPLREWKRAIPELEHALVLDPHSATLRRRLAAYFLAAAQPRRALEILQPLTDDPWTTFYRDAAHCQLAPNLGVPPSAALNPKLFHLLSGG